MIITRIWRVQPGKFFFMCTKSSTGKWRDHVFQKGKLSAVKQFIEDNQDKDIYFCPHGFKADRRIKENAVLPRLLWSDMDEVDPRTIKLKPTIAFESSPGRFVGLWQIDQPMDEKLNRRLSYAIGADKSGWDLTQVLRVPGTKNYKYSSLPTVKVMWMDGPEYTVEQLDRKMPKDKKAETNAETSDAAEVYKKYQKKLPMWLRRELINGKPKSGKRSEMIWKIQQTLIELGVDADDAFVLVKASPWNKFAGRNSEDEQLRRELDKVINQHMNAAKPVVGEEDEDELNEGQMFVSMADVVEEDVDWIVYPYLARGEVSIVEGDPGLGKSYLVQMWGLNICDGIRSPSVKSMKQPVGKVVYFDVENSASTVNKKRLHTNGLENMANFFQCEEMFSISDEDYEEVIEEWFTKTKPTIAVFDTINTYLGGADAFKGHEVSVVINLFKKLAVRHNCAVVILRHLTKSGKERALYRGQGSIAFVGTARIVMMVGVHPEEPETRVLTVSKCNICKMPQKALTFTIQGIPDTLKHKDLSKFIWGEHIDMDSDDLVAAPKKSEDNKKDGCKEWLDEVLDDGPMEVDAIMRMGEKRAFSSKTIYRAAEELGIKKRSTGFGEKKRAMWEKELIMDKRHK